ncbi:AMP-binding protein [Celerinatantimonas diazotrophica]|uniref:Long-subunit acyl-CoA synthetase (AMP-forming) n=1 Tax=Celerinatantimonas diazotrophica TaxID=412034 RepID=A0A4R1K1L6_9GAMM|nr:AMP-binding protein [Celerinatantimonas diazotrophica]TCK57790.1 long-subunit acyl-CoA synthetase (AMP-forming) [Celerinatantimonas diazotrophica]CAG9298146.1 2-succinylbenzoate--CoA ligase [Celerinatantimonas diazotrophica]
MSSRIIQSICHWAESQPDAIALIGTTAQGELSELSYRDLWAKIQTRQHELENLQPYCLAMRGENCLQWVINDLAALAGEIPLLPVPTFFTPEQAMHSVQQSGVDHLIGDWDFLTTPPELEEAFEPLLAKTAKVTFTSGSTGTPKGVCLSSEQLDAVSLQLSEVIAQNVAVERHLVMLPLSTLLENITGVYVPLLLGKTSVVLAGPDVGLEGSSHFDPARFVQALSRFQPNSLVLTPALLEALVNVVEYHSELSQSLKFIAVGGASVPKRLLERAQALGLPVYEGYGLSECASVVAVNTPASHRFGSCGKVLGHQQIKIGERGEVLVRGNMALGYIGQPFSQQWFATGDIGSIDEQGFLTIHGRLKNLIITSYGRNISPEWIETLARDYSALKQFVVMGDGEDYLSAFVIHPDKDAVIEALHELNQQLPDYAQIAQLIWCENQPSSMLFTFNARPIRSAIEQFSQSCPHFLLDTHHHPISGKTMNQFFNELKQQTEAARGQLLQSKIFAACQEGQIDRQSYRAFLTQAYHHVKHTVPLLMACGGRLDERYEGLRVALGHYIEEESGHQEWILNDIEALGFDSQLVREGTGEGAVDWPIELMVSYLYHQIDRGNPLALFGMVWMLEGTSVSVGGPMARMVQQTLELPDSAMTYLLSHSELDTQHIQFFEQLMGQIESPQDQQVIIDSARHVFRLYTAMLENLPLPVMHVA